MIKHIDKRSGVCPKQPVDCMYKSIGCHNSIAFDHHNDTEVERAETLSGRTFSFNPKRLKREDLDMHMHTNKYEHLLLINNYLNPTKDKTIPTKILDLDDEKYLKDLKHHLYFSALPEINEVDLKKLCASAIHQYESLKAENYSIRKEKNSIGTTVFEFGELQRDIKVKDRRCGEIYSLLTDMSSTKIKHLLASFSYENQLLIDGNYFLSKDSKFGDHQIKASVSDHSEGPYHSYRKRRKMNLRLGGLFLFETKK